MWGRTDRGRTEFRCAVCGVNLGARPWLGTTPNLYTRCGCYPEPKDEEMIRMPTTSEKVKAILDARPDVAAYLQGIGKIEVFAEFSKDEICGLIRASTEGVQKSLHLQLRHALEDEIPFAPEFR